MENVIKRILCSVVGAIFGYFAGLCLVIGLGIKIYGDYRKGIGPYSYLVPIAASLFTFLVTWVLSRRL